MSTCTLYPASLSIRFKMQWYIDDLQTLLGDEATTDVLWIIANTDVGTKPVSEMKNDDL